MWAGGGGWCAPAWRRRRHRPRPEHAPSPHAARMGRGEGGWNWKRGGRAGRALPPKRLVREQSPPLARCPTFFRAASLPTSARPDFRRPCTHSLRCEIQPRDSWCVATVSRTKFGLLSKLLDGARKSPRAPRRRKRKEKKTTVRIPPHSIVRHPGPAAKEGSVQPARSLLSAPPCTYGECSTGTRPHRQGLARLLPPSASMGWARVWRSCGRCTRRGGGGWGAWSQARPPPQGPPCHAAHPDLAAAGQVRMASGPASAAATSCGRQIRTHMHGSTCGVCAYVRTYIHGLAGEKPSPPTALIEKCRNVPPRRADRRSRERCVPAAPRSILVCLRGPRVW